MPKAVVIFDGIRYKIDADTATEAWKGDEVDLSQDEFDRLSALGAVAAPRSDEAKQAKADAPAPPTPPAG